MSLNVMAGACKMYILATPCAMMKSTCSLIKDFRANNGSCLTSTARTMMILFLPFNRQVWNVEEMAFAKTSPQKRIPSQRRTCWNIAPMAQMLLIRCILGVESFRSMIFMGGYFYWRCKVKSDKTKRYLTF